MKMNSNELKAQVAELISNIPDEQLEHFALTIEAVARCYQSQALHAVLLVHNDEDQTQSVYAINAATEQATEMVAALAEALRMVEKEESGPLN
jgi:hypothetical protein